MTQPNISPEINFLAETNFRSKRRKFGIKQDDRRRHMYIIGKTGMGKSTVMENMIIQDIIAGNGVALVDPHGDFAEKLLDYIPSYRVNDVIYFNPADMDFPISFNVMEQVDQEHKHLIASGLVGVFKKLWADSWGPRLEYILRNTILALLDYPGSTLLGVMRVLVDKNFRKKVIDKIQDPVVKSFWVQEFSKYSEKFANEAIAPIQNKIGQFLSTALIRNIVGQVKSSIDMRDIMDSKKILIMNLSKGRIGEDSSALLGAMMITKIQLAAMSRIDIVEDDRKDFYLYVDEFQNFATDSFASILSEARKYRLNLIIAHQYVEQLEETVRAAVFGNVGTLMTFRVGASDAEFLVKEFTPYFTEEDIVNLAKYDVYMKLMIDGVASSPFSATTLPPFTTTVKTNNREKVITVSRERYGKPRTLVEDKISKWSGVMDDEDDSPPTKKTIHVPRSKNAQEDERSTTPEPTPERVIRVRGKVASDGPVYKTEEEIEEEENQENTLQQKGSDKNTTPTTVSCYECGNETEINFVPDGIRPVYCQSCFQQKRKNKDTKKPSPATNTTNTQNQTRSEGVSLSDAFSKGAIDFKGRPDTSSRHRRDKVKESKKKPEQQKTLASKNRDSKPSPSINNTNKDKIPTSIRPGQVIKF